MNAEHDVNFYVYEYDYLFELVRYIYCIIVMCEVCDNTFDAISGLFEKPDYGHHLGWKVCHVHFHSLDVARSLFARWRECAL